MHIVAYNLDKSTQDPAVRCMACYTVYTDKMSRDDH